MILLTKKLHLIFVVSMALIQGCQSHVHANEVHHEIMKFIMLIMIINYIQLPSNILLPRTKLKECDTESPTKQEMTMASNRFSTYVSSSGFTNIFADAYFHVITMETKDN